MSKYAVIPSVEGPEVKEIDISAVFPLPENLYDTPELAQRAAPAVQDAWDEMQQKRLGDQYPAFVESERRRLAKARGETYTPPKPAPAPQPQA